jgi:hypothetical protein
VYLALYGPEGSVIFDHPYNAESARLIAVPNGRGRHADNPVLGVLGHLALATGSADWRLRRSTRFGDAASGPAAGPAGSASTPSSGRPIGRGQPWSVRQRDCTC